MGYFRVKDSQGNPKWVKEIDTVNGTLKFTDKKEQAYHRDGDYFSKAEGEYIKFNFKEKYPEISTLVVELGYAKEYVP